MESLVDRFKVVESRCFAADDDEAWFGERMQPPRVGGSANSFA